MSQFGQKKLEKKGENDPWDFKSRMKSGETLWGTMITIPSPAVAEVLVEQGYDWFFIDGEHGALEPPQILEILRAVGHRITCLVRVPEASEVAIKKVLDFGAHGIIVPQVNHAKTVADIVRWSYYAPMGSRGVGLARAHRYGATFQQYVAQANDQVVVMVQAEHIEAVNEIESIVSVPGIDGIQLGPYDLSASMGLMGQVESDEVQEALDRVCKACRARDLPVASFGVSTDSLEKDLRRGVRLICGSTDTILLGQGAAGFQKKLKAGS